MVIFVNEGHTGFTSESLRPMVVLILVSVAVIGRPSMSMTMINLTPVFVNQPYVARRSSSAWSNPKSWSAVLWGIRASKISRHDDNTKENSRASRLSGGNNETWSGLFYSWLDLLFFARGRSESKWWRWRRNLLNCQQHLCKLWLVLAEKWPCFQVGSQGWLKIVWIISRIAWMN